MKVHVRTGTVSQRDEYNTHAIAMKFLKHYFPKKDRYGFDDQLFSSVHSVVKRYIPEKQIAQIYRAYRIAYNAHGDQKRSSGLPFITHPVAVTVILAEMHLDYETLIAALLHDVIEDTPVTYQHIHHFFGSHVAKLVEGVSKLDKLRFQTRQEAQAENFRKMIMAMVNDIRVILIKLADRLHNMRTLEGLPAPKRSRIAQETLEIYAPIAHRLGIEHIKSELEVLGFCQLYPMRSRIIKATLKAAYGNRKAIIEKILSDLEVRLRDSQIQAQISGREKTLYSIYQKMQRKDQRFQSILDIYAFRIITQTVNDCYLALGIVHSLYKPKPNGFKDYIAIPKANGYQSLHTSMIGPHGFPIEVQIRTEDMDLMAKLGIAAHWVYKHGTSETTVQIRAQRWLQTLMELQQSSGNTFEFIESVKSELFPEEMYVFTPKGAIIQLPVGSTPVDFAYAVHTDIGYACFSARVNRKPYSLSQPLENGQSIEIFTKEGSHPSPMWLNFVVSSRARSKIRQVLKKIHRETSSALGLKLLKHALGCPIDTIEPSRLTTLLAELKLNSLEELLTEIALGNLMSGVIAHQLLQGMTGSIKTARSGKLSVRGTEGLLLTFANCCLPIPGDPIVAHITSGKGFVIHHESCRNLRGYTQEPEKFMAMEWERVEDQNFLTELTVEMLSERNALARLTAAINTMDAIVKKFSTEERDHNIYVANVSLYVKSRQHLAKVVRKIRMLSGLIKVFRNQNNRNK